jgi:hypothetical protein
LKAPYDEGGLRAPKRLTAPRLCGHNGQAARRGLKPRAGRLPWRLKPNAHADHFFAAFGNDNEWRLDVNGPQGINSGEHESR